MGRTISPRQCAILVGGLGTRLGALTATTPKPLLDCGGRPFLAWLMREFVRFGVRDFVLLAGHLTETIRLAVPAIAVSLPIDVKITVSEEPVRAGTGGALSYASDLLDERFWLCNGDSFLDCNLARLLASAARDGPEIAVRMVLRRVDDASRFGVVDLTGDEVTDFHERGQPGQGGLINGGIYIVDRGLLAEVPAISSLERDVLPKLARQQRVRGSIAEGYFVDIGVPADLERGRGELPRRLRRPALFLARDVVTRQAGRHPGGHEPFEWDPAVVDAIAYANDSGAHVFVVDDHAAGAGGGLNGRMVDMLHAQGATIDDIGLVPGDAPASSAQMPPLSRAIVSLALRWEVDPRRSVFIGNSISALDAAEAAGLRGRYLDGHDLLATVRSAGVRADV